MATRICKSNSWGEQSQQSTPLYLAVQRAWCISWRRQWCIKLIFCLPRMFWVGQINQRVLSDLAPCIVAEATITQGKFCHALWPDICHISEGGQKCHAPCSASNKIAIIVPLFSKCQNDQPENDHVLREGCRGSNVEAPTRLNDTDGWRLDGTNVAI